MSKLAEALASCYVGDDRYHTAAPELVGDETKRKFSGWRKHEGAPTLEDFQAHVEGRRRLFVSPLRDGKVKFGQIDIDQKLTDEDFLELCTRLKLDRVPVTVTKSKSGGAHVDVYFDQWEDAESAADAVRGIVARCAFGKNVKVEILVNTTKLLTVPYFGDEETGCWIGQDSETGKDKLLTYPGARDRDILLSSNLLEHERLADMTMWADEMEDAKASGRRKARVRREPTIPTDVASRHDLIAAVLGSCRGLGWDRKKMSEYIYAQDARKFDDHIAYSGQCPLQDDERDNGKAQIESLLKWFAARDPGKAGDPETVDAMNEQYAYMVIGDKGCILDLKAFARGDLENYFIQKQTFFDMYAGTSVRVGDKVKSTAQVWFEDPGRRCYRGFTFAPDFGEDVPNRGDFPYRNLFKGYGREPKKGDVSPWYRHLNLLASNDEAVVHQLTQYAADLIQNPGDRGPGISIMLHGEEGNGKSTYGASIREALGWDYSFEVHDPDELFGRFTSHLIGRPLILVEEATFAGSPKMTSRLKTRTTAPVVNFEGKFKGIVQMRNNQRLICSTNDKHALTLSANDRRWLVVKVPTYWDNNDPESVKERDAYFKPYYAWLSGDGGAALLYHLLHEVKVDREALKTPVVTKAKVEQQTLSFSLLEQFLVDAANSGILPQDELGAGVASPEAVRDVLHEMQRKGGFSREKIPHFMRREIAEYLPLGPAKDDPFTWYKSAPFDDRPKRARGIKFPPLAEARAVLAKKLRFSDWDEGVIEWRAATDEKVVGLTHVEHLRERLRQAEMAEAIASDDYPL
jgi:hypothetical protein